MSAQPPVTTAQLAKGALRRMAQAQQEPTPDHYRQAYEAECQALGVPVPASASAVASEPVATEPSRPDDGPRWAELVGRITRGLERSHRQWTSARKKDSLQRVLEGSKHSGDKLLQRLGQLVQSWDSDQADTPSLEADAPPTSPAVEQSVIASVSPAAPPPSWLGDLVRPPLAAALPAGDAACDEARHQLDRALDGALAALTVPEAQQAEARDALAAASEQGRRVIAHRQQVLDQLVQLCRSLTDSLVDLSEDDSWVQGQCTAMRAELDEGLGPRGARRIQQLLESTRLRQQTLRQEREAARHALKQLIHQMLHEIADLGQTTGRFQDNLVRYADTIGQADSLQSLTGVVRELVEESRAVHGVVSQAQERLQTEHSRASELTEKVRLLEDEIRKLSDEVSTDPLTQIANRRGMMRAFEAERSRVERGGGTLAIGLLDVDNFKKLNDTLGHQTGDEALKFLARRVGHHLRPSDALARYGGEEFVVMLPDTPLDEAQLVLTRVQRQLSAEFFTQDEQKVFITFSAGVTLYRPGEAIEVALDRADMALYEAKRTGKNRTCMA